MYIDTNIVRKYYQTEISKLKSMYTKSHDQFKLWQQFKLGAPRHHTEGPEMEEKTCGEHTHEVRHCKHLQSMNLHPTAYSGFGEIQDQLRDNDTGYQGDLLQVTTYTFQICSSPKLNQFVTNLYRCNWLQSQ